MYRQCPMGNWTCVLGPATPVCYPPSGGDPTVSSDSESATMVMHILIGNAINDIAQKGLPSSQQSPIFSYYLPIRPNSCVCIFVYSTFFLTFVSSSNNLASKQLYLVHIGLQICNDKFSLKMRFQMLPRFAVTWFLPQHLRLPSKQCDMSMNNPKCCEKQFFSSRSD